MDRDIRILFSLSIPKNNDQPGAPGDALRKCLELWRTTTLLLNF